MKPQVPWSVKGIDDDARAAAKDAARRSGLSLGAWLNELILKEAEAHGPPVKPAADSPGEMAARLDEIARKLNALTAEEQQTAVGRVMPSGDAAQGEAALAALLQRIDAHERETGARIGELVQRIEALRRDVAAAGRRIAQNTAESPAGYFALDSALRNVVEHIETAEAQNRSALASIQQRLAELDVRSQAAPETAPVAAALQKLEAHVAEMAGELRTLITRAEVEALIHDETAPLTARMDGVDRSMKATLAQASAAAEEAARRSLENVDATIEALVRRALSAQESEVRLLRATVDTMSRRVGDPASAGGLGDLERRVSDLDRALREAAPEASVVQALADLEARVNAIDTALETQLAQQRLGAFDGPAPDDADLTGRLDDLAQRLAQTEGQLSHLETIETAITQLYHVLEENRSHIERTAMGGATSNGGLPADVAALAQGLAAIQLAAAESDRRTQDTLKSVHETLEGIIARLSALDAEDSGRDQGTEPTAETGPARPVAAPETSYLGETWTDVRPQARPETEADPFASAGEGLSEPQAATTAAPEPENAPQPVTWQRPVFGQRAGPIWTEAVRARLAEVTDQGGRREPTFVDPPMAPNAWDEAGITEAAPAGEDQKVRTDFIAAARRAAQAAAAAGVPVEDEPGRLDEPVSRLKSVLGMLKRSSGGDAATGKADRGSRKRLVLVGLLLLAAVSAFALKGRTTGEVPTAAPAVTAPAPVLANNDKTSGAAAKSAPADPSPVRASDKELTLNAKPPQLPAVTALAGLADAGATASLGDVVGGVPGPEAGPAALRKAAAAGDRLAQFVVASNYLDDRGKRPDYAAAAQWLEKAARQGLAPAAYRLGTLYERGRGVPLDLRAAALLYDSAARKGNVRAMHNLAVISTGTNGGSELTMAAYWFGQAASYGLKDSQFNLAILYERGMGVGKDLAQAYFWYALAARQGDPDAQARLNTLKDAVKASLPDINRKLAAFQPRVPDRVANVVAVSDPQWRAEVPALPPAPAVPPADGPQVNGAQTPTLQGAETIASVQMKLQKLGFDIEVDGKMGSRTANAIRLFQLEHGLPVNGAMSAELVAALAATAG